MTSSKKVPPNDCDNDRQPEIAIWPPKPEIIYFNSTWNYNRLRRNSNGNSVVFDYVELKYFRFRRHIAISGYRSLSQSLGGTLFELSHSRKARIAVGISTLSIIFPEIKVLPV